MTTTLDPDTLPCPEGWRWESFGPDSSRLCAPRAVDGRWSALVEPAGHDWCFAFDAVASRISRLRWSASRHPTPIAAARAALIALADAGHPEAAALRAAAGEAPSGPGATAGGSR